METKFYQISGFRAHSNSWFKKFDDKVMIRRMMESKTLRPRGKDSALELVLGILPSGASYLLMPQEQTFKFTRDYNLHLDRAREPWRATQFLSLSPIAFDDADALAAKIATFKQRPRNKNRRENEAPVDNSQANRGYVLAGTTNVVHFRGYFEQQRTLYRLLVKELQPDRVGLAKPAWWDRGVRVVALVFGEWAVDVRPRSQRLEDPWLVDAGWTDTFCPAFFESERAPRSGTTTTTTVHVRVTTSRKNPAAKKSYFSEVVEDDMEGLERRLRALLRHEAEIPLIVLVHDEDMARGILARANVDVGGWSSGLSDLLPIDNSAPAATPRPALVDAQKLVKAVMEINPGQTVPHSAKVLRMQTDTKTCAGDDSLLLLHMWTSMAQGLTIDDQRKAREHQESPCAQVLAPPPHEAQPSTGEDMDPNDFDPNDADPSDMLPGPQPTKADDFSSDDDW